MRTGHSRWLQILTLRDRHDRSRSSTKIENENRARYDYDCSWPRRPEGRKRRPLTWGVGLPFTLQTNVTSDPSISWKFFSLCSKTGGLASSRGAGTLAGVTWLGRVVGRAGCGCGCDGGGAFLSLSPISIMRRFSKLETWNDCNSDTRNITRRRRTSTEKFWFTMPFF